MSTSGSFYTAARAILAAIGTTPTDTNINLLVAWELCEQKTGQEGNAWAWNNPLSTTEPSYGGTAANEAGVRQYPTQADGAAATAATLENGRYPTILKALQTSDSSLFFSATDEMATWGTDMQCIRENFSTLPAPPTLATPTSTGSAQNGVEYTVTAATSTAPPAPEHMPWLGWGLVGASLLAAGATVAVIETDTHWSTILRWLHN